MAGTGAAWAAGLDPSFGLGGRVFHGSEERDGTLLDDGLHAAVVEPGGKVIASGFTSSGRILVRFGLDGKLDTSFGSGGYAPVAGANQLLRTTSDGRFVAGGLLMEGGPCRCIFSNHTLARFSAQGILDTSFAGGQYRQPAAQIPMTGLAPQSDGGIAFVTWFGLRRVRPDGSADTPFDNATGEFTFPEMATALAPRASGGLAVALKTADGMAIRFFTDAGVPGATRSLQWLPGKPHGAQVLLPLQDGSLWAGGYADSFAFVSRLRSDGTPDPSFGQGGVFLTHGQSIAGLAPTSDGGVYALTSAWEVLRLDRSGVLDPAFGIDGRMTIPSGTSTDAKSIAIDDAARVLVAGTGKRANKDLALARIDPLAGAGLSLDSAHLDFVSRLVGSKTRRSVKIANRGSATRQVLSVSIVESDPYSLRPFSQTNDCASLPADGSCSIDVEYAASTSTNDYATLLIDTDAGPYAVALSGSGAKSLVSHYYRSVLRREPDALGEYFWEAERSRMASLEASPNEVWYAMAMSFFGTTEYAAQQRNPTEFVTDLYGTFLDRVPDSAGFAYWTQRLAEGLPREVVLAGFMFSAEFRSFTQGVFGTATSRPEVDAVLDFYRGLLGRLPDDAGFGHWLARFRKAQCLGAGAIAAEADAISAGFLDSTEYVSRSRSARQLAGDLYNAFLRRGGDPDGVKYWVAQLESGALTRDSLRRAFMSSPEFQARLAAIASAGCK